VAQGLSQSLAEVEPAPTDHQQQIQEGKRVRLHVHNWRLSACGAVAVIAVGLGLGACGSASSSSSRAAAASSGGSSSTSASSGSSSSASSGAADPTKVYAPGVPTLAELYKGDFGTPPTSSPPIAKKKTIIFVSCGQAAPGCAGVPNEMATPAKMLGWNYRIIDGQLNANNGWSNGIRQAIAAHPDAIVVHGMNCPDVRQALLDAKAAKIPVMGLEDVDCNDAALPGGPESPLFSIPIIYNTNIPNGQAYFTDWGKFQAAYIIDATQGHAKIIQTVYQPIFGVHQYAGQNEELAKCSGCQVLVKIPFGASDQTPNGPLFQKFSTDLVKYPDANAAMLNFDTDVNTAELSKAVVDAGRANSMTVVGGEGYAPALQLIRTDQGDNGEAAHDGHWMAWAAVDELNRYFNHQAPVPEGIGFVIIDKNHNMMPAGQDFQTSINYKAAYEKIWGVG
jgi:ribose transport system substrate-binding protein